MISIVCADGISLRVVRDQSTVEGGKRKPDTPHSYTATPAEASSRQSADTIYEVTDFEEPAIYEETDIDAAANYQKLGSRGSNTGSRPFYQNLAYSNAARAQKNK